MIKFDKPKNLNGAELIEELLAVGIQIDTNTSPYIDGLGHFYLDIVEGDVDVAAKVVAAHNGTTVAPEPDIEDKLASVGLNLADLKSALGL